MFILTFFLFSYLDISFLQRYRVILIQSSLDYVRLFDSTYKIQDFVDSFILLRNFWDFINFTTWSYMIEFRLLSLFLPFLFFMYSVNLCFSYYLIYSGWYSYCHDLHLPNFLGYISVSKSLTYFLFYVYIWQMFSLWNISLYVYLTFIFAPFLLTFGLVFFLHHRYDYGLFYIEFCFLTWFEIF